MNSFTAMLGSLKDPLEFLEHFDAQEALDAGFDSSTVRKWGTIHEVYFKRTKWSRQQAFAVSAAREGQFTSDQLYLIESRIKHISDEGEKWRLRLRLLSIRGRHATLKRKASEIVPEKEKPTPTKTVGFGKSREGMRPLNAMGPEEDMAALEYALRKHVTSDAPAGPQMLEALMGMLGLRPRDAGGDSSPTEPSPDFPSVPRPLPSAPRPLVLIPLPEYVKIIRGSGDETVLGLTDGTTMTGADYLTRYHGAELEVATFHPQEGAVNLYRTQRLANQKQRDLARASLSTCPVPDCRHATDNCEIHHIDAWSRGGMTNMANLVPLCRYHNRTNDDDPGRRRRGSIVNIRGRPTWVSPRGYPVVNGVHPFGAMNLLFGVSAGSPGS